TKEEVAETATEEADATPEPVADADKPATEAAPAPVADKDDNDDDSVKEEKKDGA
ncbi:MAG: hypothetical protein F6K39_32880, partial [Okeania sp. SIO3B3]|nr:hypothetical protein [Okeania sp. SIO3B3]